MATPAAQRERWDRGLLIDWGPLPGSYGWVFPKGATLTVGVIGDRGDGPALRGYLDALLAAHGLSAADAVVSSGHLTRCRGECSPLRVGRVLLAGDAAGLLEPMMREGISFALRSGRLAGMAAADGREAALAAYDPEVRATLGAEMAAGRALLAALERRPAAFALGAATRPGWAVFQRFVRGRTTLPGLLAQRGVRPVVGLLAGRSAGGGMRPR